MDAWGDHIQAVLEDQEALADGSEPPGTIDLDVDPELEAHFARAYNILEQLGRVAPPKATVSDQVAASPVFSLLFDSEGKSVAASRIAKQLLGGTAELGDMLAELTPVSVDLVQQLFASARLKRAAVPPVVLSSALTPRHRMARLVPVPTEHGAPTLLVAIEGLEFQWSDSAGDMLVSSFGLSRAEVELVRNLLGGNNLKQIAEQTGRSEHTVRNQAKSVLSKTGAPSQVDLIRLVVFLINTNDAQGKNRSSNIDLPYELLEMESTGMTMQLFRIGSSTARPVVFFHGMIDGPAPLKRHAAEFMDRNFQVLMPVRAGFGKSTPVDRVDQAVDIAYLHTKELIERFELDRPVLMSHLGGSLYANTVASRVGDLITGTLSVSGNAPITRLGQFRSMPPRQRVVAYTARFAPALLPTVLRAGIAQIDGKEVTEFMNSLFAPGTWDNGIIQKHQLANLLQSGFRFTVEQGQAGFETDSYFVVRDWGGQLGKHKTRSIFLNGEIDPVVSAQSVVDGMKGRENVEVRVIPGVGQLMFYDQPNLVLDVLDELFDGR